MDSPKTVAERIVAEWPCDHDEISADDWRMLKSSVASALRTRDEAHAEEVKRLRDLIQRYLAWQDIPDELTGHEWEVEDTKLEQVIKDMRAALTPAKEVP